MPLDPFLASILRSFKKSRGYEQLDDSAVFERLVAFCSASTQHPLPFQVDDICTGGGQDLGIDGIAVIASGHVITTIDEWNDITKLLRRVDVTFVLSQAKMSGHFDSSSIGTFLEGALALFQSSPSMPENDAISHFRALKDQIYSDTPLLAERPNLYLHYACSGTWKADPHVEARATAGRARLDQLMLFRRVEFQPIDSERLRSIYAELSQPVSVTINFPNHTTMPEISRVVQSYIGVISCEEYLKLIQDDKGQIRRSVFSDNVRDFQGDNEVNKEIHATVSNSVEQQWLPLLNNGATVVAKQLKQVGTKFTLDAFQIVNGCQTSYVLWTNAESIKPDVMIPLRLIETRDLEFTAKVIQATNRQTRIEIEAFESLKSFHRDLEEYYNAWADKSPIPLRYERRSGQYDWSDTDVKYIVSLASQINAYVSVFLEEPQSVHRYYGEVLHKYRTRLFRDDAKDYSCYYTSAMAMYCVNALLTRAHAKMRPFRSQIALLIRMTIGNISGKAKDREAYAGKFYSLLTDRNAFTIEFHACLAIIEEELKHSTSSSPIDLSRRKDFTQALIQRRRATLTSRT